jgi:hypothetical protein
MTLRRIPLVCVALLGICSVTRATVSGDVGANIYYQLRLGRPSLLDTMRGMMCTVLVAGDG